MIFLADDDPDMRNLLASSLRRAGYQVELAASGDALVDKVLEADARGRPPDLIISDVRMGGRDGLSVLAWVSRRFANLPVILITAFGDERTHARAVALGAAAVLNKPFELAALRERVEAALATTRAR